MKEKELDLENCTVEEGQQDTEKLDADFAIEYTSGLVGIHDDTSTPAFTIRMLFLGILWAVLLSSLNIIGTFRDITLSLPTQLASIMSYPMGIFFAAVLPDWRIFGMRLNPGPFSVKEHVLVYIIASSAASKPYGKIFIYSY